MENQQQNKEKSQGDYLDSWRRLMPQASDRELPEDVMPNRCKFWQLQIASIGTDLGLPFSHRLNP